MSGSCTLDAIDDLSGGFAETKPVWPYIHSFTKDLLSTYSCAMLLKGAMGSHHRVYSLRVYTLAEETTPQLFRTLKSAT